MLDPVTLLRSDDQLFQPSPDLSTHRYTSFDNIDCLADLLDFISRSTGSYVHKQSDSVFTPVEVHSHVNASNRLGAEFTSVPLPPNSDNLDIYKECDNGEHKKMSKMRVSSQKTVLFSTQEGSTLQDPNSVVLSGLLQNKRSDPLTVGFGDIQKTKKSVSFGDPELLLFHNKKLPLYVDKYLFAAIPDIQTEFLLEGAGVSPDDYVADLDPSYRFHVQACVDGDLLNEFIVPIIRGGSSNPYVRFLSSKASAGGQALKLFDLIGVPHLSSAELDEFSLVDCPSFDLITLTFPFEISVLLMSDKTRDVAMKKMWTCYKRFFTELRYLFDIPADGVLGSSASLHIWSSKFPFMPHAHFHSALPHFFFKKVDCDQRLKYELDIDVPDVVSYGGRSFVKGRLYQRLYDHIVTMELNRNIFPRKKGGDVFSSSFSNDRDGVLLASGNKRMFHSFIDDIPTFQDLHNEISSKFSGLIGFNVLDWLGSITRVTSNGSSYTFPVPFDVDSLRFIWTEIVNDVFDIGSHPDIDLDGVPEYVPYDIYVEYASTKNSQYCRPKLLHFLAYKSRPPVLDVDLFFRDCPGFVVDHNRINRSVVLSYISDKLAAAHRFNDEAAISTFESLSAKINAVFDQFSDVDLIAWLRYLSIHKTTTKVFGFWRTIKRYRVSSVTRKRIPLPRICPICGGDVVSYRHLNSLSIDAIILHSGSKFHLFSIDKPPPLDLWCDGGVIKC